MPGSVPPRGKAVGRASRQGEGRAQAWTKKTAECIGSRHKNQRGGIKQFLDNLLIQSELQRRPTLQGETARIARRNDPFQGAERAVSAARSASHRLEPDRTGGRLHKFQPKSGAGLHPVFVLPPGRLLPAFVEDVAGYSEKKREAKTQKPTTEKNSGGLAPKNRANPPEYRV